MSYTIEKGKEGERFVAAYLTDNGYTVLHTNYRHRQGEVDIIGQKNTVIAFVEVKLRSNPLVDPAEIITISKQKKIVSVAKLFLSQHTNQNITYRFDVALVEKRSNTLTIRYIENAFEAFD